jgi:hypothetical protein
MEGGEMSMAVPAPLIGYQPGPATEEDLKALSGVLAELKKAMWSTTDIAKKRELFKKISRVRGALSAAQRSVRYGSMVNRLVIEEAKKITP